MFKWTWEHTAVTAAAMLFFLTLCLYCRENEINLEARLQCLTNHPPLECEKAFP